MVLAIEKTLLLRVWKLSRDSYKLVANTIGIIQNILKIIYYYKVLINSIT